MGALADGATAGAVMSQDERQRLRAVEVAWQLLLEHPHWRGEHGLSTEGVRWGEFATATAQLFEDVTRQVEFEMAQLGESVHLLDCECFEAVSIAAFLRLTGRRPTHPLPIGVGGTWFALARYWTQVLQDPPGPWPSDSGERAQRRPARAASTRAPRTVH